MTKNNGILTKFHFSLVLGLEIHFMQKLHCRFPFCASVRELFIECFGFVYAHNDTLKNPLDHEGLMDMEKVLKAYIELRDKKPSHIRPETAGLIDQLSRKALHESNKRLRLWQEGKGIFTQA